MIAPSTQEPPAVELLPQRLRLLVADDAPDVAEVVAFGARLAWPDCHAVLAADGQAALTRFAEERFDLVVLDVQMPPPDGFEVLRRIRETSQVPVLMLTVRDATLDKVRALDLGADDYLTKPFDHLELLARLRALVRRAALHATGPAANAGGERRWCGRRGVRRRGADRGLRHP